MKRVISTLLVFVMGLTFFSSPANSTENQPQIDWPQEILPTNEGNVGYLIYGGSAFQAGLPAVFTDKGICDSPNLACLTNAKTLNYMPGYFNLCANSPIAPCVISVAARKGPDEDWVQGEVSKEISYKPSDQRISEWISSQNPKSLIRVDLKSASKGIGWNFQSDTGLPGSASGPIVFRIPGFGHAGNSETYTLDARFEIDTVVKNSKPVSKQIGNITISLRPTNILTGIKGHTPIRSSGTDVDGSLVLQGEPGSNADRTYITETEEGKATAFSSGDWEFKVLTKLPASTIGWFHGRLNEPDIEIKTANSNENIVAFSGKPALVPITSSYMPLSEAQNKNPNLINKSWPKAYVSQIRSQQRNGIDEWSSSQGLDALFNAWLPFMKPRALGSSSSWMINTLPTSQTSNSCLRSKNEVAGIVTTNAMAYQAGPPQFSNGFLDYKVAGVHFDKSGSVSKGNYDLIMRASIARCLYGFSSAPISATISVLDDANQSAVATTLVSQDSTWLRLSAKNFTFSKKKISTRIAQKRTFTLKGFASKNGLLNLSQRTELRTLLSKNKYASSLVCTVAYSTNESLAKMQAKSVCDLAKTLRKFSKISTTVEPTNSVGEVGLVRITTE